MSRKKKVKKDKGGRGNLRLANHIKSAVDYFATEHGSRYQDTLSDYMILLNIFQKMSTNQGGITTDPRGVRGMKVFTRETCLALSLFHLLPYSMERNFNSDNFCDLVAISSIARGILECYHCLVYFGTERISEEEAHLRFMLNQCHRNIEWFNSFSHVKMNNNCWEKEFIEGIPRAKEAIRSLPILNTLTKEQQSRVRKFNAIYKTKSDYARENVKFAKIDVDYKILSNFSHPVFISLERIDDINGKGNLTPYDTDWLILFINLAMRYLSFSAMEILGYFPERFVKVLGSDQKILEKIYQSWLPSCESIAIWGYVDSPSLMGELRGWFVSHSTSLFPVTD